MREKNVVVSFARDLFFAFAFSYCARRACLASETFLRRACISVRDLDVSLPARERVKRSFQIAESRSGRRRDVGIGREMTRAFGLDGVALNCGPFSAGECLECEWRARVGFSFFIDADRALGTMRRRRRRLTTRFFASIGRSLWTRWMSTVVFARDDRSRAHLCFFRVFRRPWNVYLLLFLFLARSSHHTDSKTFSKPRRPFEKVRLDAELKTVGEYGLRNKRELWRVQFALNKLRNAARVLLTLDEDDPKRIFEGNAILKRMRTYGLLEADKESLDYVLALTAEEFLERRLQTLVFKLGLAKSVHHARILIKQRHIRVGKQIVNVPSFLVRVETQKHIDFALNSPLGGGRPGRVKRRRMAQKAAAAGGDDEEEEE